jgi:hypothetical protein
VVRGVLVNESAQAPAGVASTQHDENSYLEKHVPRSADAMRENVSIEREVQWESLIHRTKYRPSDQALVRRSWCLRSVGEKYHLRERLRRQ